jgi:hypothetical protein
MGYTTLSKSAVQWIINKCKATFLPKTGGTVTGGVEFWNSLCLGTALDIIVTDKSASPSHARLVDMNGRTSVFNGIKALTAQGDYLYCADLNPKYTVTSNYASLVKEPRDISGKQIEGLFDNNFASNFMLYTANLETTPWVLTIRTSDNSSITATDTLSLWFFQHRLYSSYGKVQSYKVEVLAQNNSTNVWEWMTVVERTNVNDILNGIIVPVWYNDGIHGNAAYGNIRGIRITISKADSTGSFREGFLPICAVQLRDHRPSMKPSEGLGALDIRGGNIFGPVIAKGPTAKFVGALQGNADTATNAAKVNEHTVESNVPANAKFTDTTYPAATASSDGLMAKADKAKLDGFGVATEYAKKAEVALKPIVYQNITVPASAWGSGAGFAGVTRTRYADIALAGVTSDLYATVTFNPDDIDNYNLAGICATKDGKITIYAEYAPSVAITIPTIICLKA